MFAQKCIFTGMQKSLVDLFEHIFIDKKFHVNKSILLFTVKFMFFKELVIVLSFLINVNLQ